MTEHSAALQMAAHHRKRWWMIWQHQKQRWLMGWLLHKAAWSQQKVNSTMLCTSRRNYVLVHTYTYIYSVYTVSDRKLDRTSLSDNYEKPPTYIHAHIHRDYIFWSEREQHHNSTMLSTSHGNKTYTHTYIVYTLTGQMVDSTTLSTSY